MFSKVAKWIQTNSDSSAPIIKKEFNINCFDRAEIKISGLGFYELFINGKRVGNEYFKPVVSDYFERDFSKLTYPLTDKTSHTIYYNKYDITKYLQKGKNVIAIMLGNGYFKQKKRMDEGDTSFGECLMACYDMQIFDGKNCNHIYSDGNEKVIEGFIKENNIFYGETQDFGNQTESVFSGEYHNGDYCFPKTVLPPDAKYLLQKCKADKIARSITPELVSENSEKKIFDCFENISGFVEIISGGGDIAVTHAEDLKDGQMYYFTAGGENQISKIEYKNTVKGQVLHPWFCWSAFRFFEISGNIKNVKVKVLYNGIKITSRFNSGNETLNWLYDSYIRTQLDNMHCGFPSDCPHRERLGYTGDGQITCETAMLLSDSKAFYRKWIQDILDCQDINSGHVQHTAPFFGGGGGPGGWGSAVVVVPYSFYKIYKDKGIIRKSIFAMQKYLNFTYKSLEEWLVVKECEKGWCLGDWCTVEQCVIPEPYVNTCYFIYCMNLVEKMSEIIGLNLDYSKWKSKCKDAIYEKYFDENKNTFCNGIQGADAFALFAGIAGDSVLKSIVEKYSKLKKFDTGIFGTPLLLKCLSENGENQLAYELLTAKGYPSFDYMREHGATTLWEHWKGEYSRNHPMFGASVRYIFYGFLGINIDDTEKTVIIKPTHIKKLGFIEGEIEIDKSKLFVRQEFEDNGTKIVVCNSSDNNVFVETEGGLIKCEKNETKRVFHVVIE